MLNLSNLLYFQCCILHIFLKKHKIHRGQNKISKAKTSLHNKSVLLYCPWFLFLALSVPAYSVRSVAEAFLFPSFLNPYPSSVDATPSPVCPSSGLHAELRYYAPGYLVGAGKNNYQR